MGACLARHNPAHTDLCAEYIFLMVIMVHVGISTTPFYNAQKPMPCMGNIFKCDILCTLYAVIVLQCEY